MAVSTLRESLQLFLEDRQPRSQGLAPGGKMRDPGNEVGRQTVSQVSSVWRPFYILIFAA